MQQTFTTERQNAGLILLPYFFKWVGLILFVLSILIPELMQLINPRLLKANIDFVDTIQFPVALGGLLMVIFSFEKEEDELPAMWRMKALSVSFLSTCIFIMIYPFIGNFIYGEMKMSQLQAVALYMTMTDILFFYIFKFRRFSKKKDTSFKLENETEQSAEKIN